MACVVLSNFELLRRTIGALVRNAIHFTPLEWTWQSRCEPNLFGVVINSSDSA
jgi:hypothetical protein